MNQIKTLNHLKVQRNHPFETGPVKVLSQISEPPLTGGFAYGLITILSLPHFQSKNVSKVNAIQRYNRSARSQSHLKEWSSQPLSHALFMGKEGSEPCPGHSFAIIYGCFGINGYPTYGMQVESEPDT